MQMEHDSLEFSQVVNFELCDSLKRNGAKNLLFFDNSSEAFCSSKVSGDNSTARKHCVLSTFPIKQPLFHGKKIFWGVALRN